MHTFLEDFQQEGTPTQLTQWTIQHGTTVPCYTNSFWTPKQRAANRLHEVSYRACYKPQLPRFFIEALTHPGDTIYDPFMGRGTTLIEAAFMGRIPTGCDINPLSQHLIAPRLTPPSLADIEARLATIPTTWTGDIHEDLLVFFHPDTLRQLHALRHYLEERQHTHPHDPTDAWIRMVATNRLTGHSPGFFSVYTLPPNQAVSIASQRKINAKRQQAPEAKALAPRILKKSKQLLSQLQDPTLRATLTQAGQAATLLTQSADHTPQIADRSIDLIITSPPFLSVIDYQTDNWLRCWFNGIDAHAIPIWQIAKADDWQHAMQPVFHELQRIMKPGAWLAFEVGEIHHGKLKMEELVAPLALAAGLTLHSLIINAQDFTKTAHIWGTNNQAKGTNTNRIILLQRPI